MCRQLLPTSAPEARKRRSSALAGHDERSKAWERLIPRADKSLEKNCVVCEAHLDERFIVRTYKHVINGETVQIRRDRPCLTPDAIRTVFPNVPSYLTKKLQPKRKTAASNVGLWPWAYVSSQRSAGVRPLTNPNLGPTLSAKLGPWPARSALHVGPA
ncbi:hypothetical protein HPB52_018565 [Rhipicephalus sanguineus]|uniref:THAP-type domain-containing protein n=1 Tax=Rhipicephalus sanguineus TaxID=34632 RepID=A0A9D4PYC0_RHISA|nr:hypothetical protein HPB52_018565 [Rhipicephalus sanguineus]